MAEKEQEVEAEDDDEEEVNMLPVELLPGVDMDEMRLHVMLRQPADLLQGRETILSTS